MPTTWTPAMSTGVPKLDQQHQELIKRLDELLAAMGKGVGKEQLSGMVKFLGEYAVKHFRDEEAAMAQHDCPAAAANAAAHERFVQIFGNFQKRLETEGPSTSMVLAVQRELLHWVYNHIQQIDTQLAPCARRKAG